ncbi:uncharacterized protein RCC_01075 [Ramularia collo-cygni]|uniref:Fungal N-terminal domain-containing protein n=1 Tax=Ramularia collo-cygni TaxID=112498 RepID=A0A2D3UYG0_9PEZI|nr:uncharacterized protein RCC_01075 [Ramularia collo-cygni]CZT15194.1 uncharacterized protein RCC_01075 [Ramularia collo-cygni]
MRLLFLLFVLVCRPLFLQTVVGMVIGQDSGSRASISICKDTYRQEVEALLSRDSLTITTSALDAANKLIDCIADTSNHSKAPSNEDLLDATLVPLDTTDSYIDNKTAEVGKASAEWMKSIAEYKERLAEYREGLAERKKQLAQWTKQLAERDVEVKSYATHNSIHNSDYHKDMTPFKKLPSIVVTPFKKLPSIVVKPTLHETDAAIFISDQGQAFLRSRDNAHREPGAQTLAEWLGFHQEYLQGFGCNFEEYPWEGMLEHLELAEDGGLDKLNKAGLRALVRSQFCD